MIKAKDEESEEPWTGVDHHYIIADRHITKDILKRVLKHGRRKP